MNEPNEQHGRRVASTRREFLERCAGIVGGITIVGFVSPILSSCAPSSTGPFGETPEIGTGGNNGATGGGTNNGKMFNVSGLTADGQALLTSTKGSDGFAIMIVRQSEGRYAALSTRCTHQSCPVNDALDNGSLYCGCHGSRFGLDGGVITGPATAPLKSYPTTYNASNRTVTVTVS